MSQQSKIEDGESAFPRPLSTYGGMSLRQYLAAHAPALPMEFEQAAVSVASEQACVDDDPDKWQGLYLHLVAKWNYRYADTMIKVGKAVPSE
jgi:hypothetical protein